MSSSAAMEEVRNRYGLRCGYCGVHEYEVGARLEVDHYCIASQVCQQKDTGSLQRPVAHTGSYTMEATLFFSPFNPCSCRTRVERGEKMSFLGAR